MCHAHFLRRLKVLAQVDGLALAGQVIELTALHRFLDNGFDELVERHYSSSAVSASWLGLPNEGRCSFWSVSQFMPRYARRVNAICSSNADGLCEKIRGWISTSQSSR